MKHALKLKNNGQKSSASVVDGKLILSFPDAKTPVVWQMDFSEVKASALEVKESKDKKTYTLTLRTLKGETVDIAPFEKREDAVNGLMAASRALENAHGHIRPGGGTSDGNKVSFTSSGGPQKQSKWKGTALVIVLFLVLIWIWGALTPRSPNTLSSDYISQSTLDSSARSAFSSPGANESGVPLSAEDFLRAQ